MSFVICKVKFCLKCENHKTLTEEFWGKKVSCKDGWCTRCKECCRLQNKQYRQDNSEKERTRGKKWREENPEYQKQYRGENQEKYKDHYRKWREKNPDRYREYNKQYYLDNSEKIRERAKKWRTNNPDRYREYKREHQKKRREDPQYRLHANFSGGIYKSIKDKNNSHCFDLIWYSKEQLIECLESQFDENMTWDNYGPYWHIDHIIPQSYFNFESYKDGDFKKCWALSNLRPLEASENLIKNNSIIKEYKEVLKLIEQEIEGK